MTPCYHDNGWPWHILFDGYQMIQRISRGMKRRCRTRMISCSQIRRDSELCSLAGPVLKWGVRDTTVWGNMSLTYGFIVEIRFS